MAQRLPTCLTKKPSPWYSSVTGIKRLMSLNTRLFCKSTSSSWLRNMLKAVKIRNAPKTKTRGPAAASRRPVHDAD